MVRPSVRFDVLKRDDFTCTYCGRKPPEVKMQVDHVVPRAVGGSDDYENLIAACIECNQGKAANMLEEGKAQSVNASRIRAAKQRLREAKALHKAAMEKEALVAEQVDTINAAWCSAFGGTQSDSKYHCDVWFPNASSLRRSLATLGVHEVLDAVHIAASRYNGSLISKRETSRYFFGICKHKAIRAGLIPDPGRPRTAPGAAS